MFFIVSNTFGKIHRLTVERIRVRKNPLALTSALCRAMRNLTEAVFIYRLLANNQSWVPTFSVISKMRIWSRNVRRLFKSCLKTF